MEYDEFRTLAGRGVTIESPTGSLEARVDSVSRLPDSAGGSRIPYSVIIKGPVEPLLAQGTYPLTIDEQRLELFMVPIGPEDEQMCYEIIFN